MQNEKLKIEERKPVYDIKQRSYRFALEIIRYVDSLQISKTNSVLTSQLLRSATSIGANIIEAQAASSKNDFRNFLNHALKSANETKYWLALLRDSGKKSKEDTDPLLLESNELSNILAASILTLKKK